MNKPSMAGAPTHAFLAIDSGTGIVRAFLPDRGAVCTEHTELFRRKGFRVVRAPLAKAERALGRRWV
jgi:hypothetical protein